MRYAEPADELVVESLTTLGAPLTLHYLLTGHTPMSTPGSTANRIRSSAIFCTRWVHPRKGSPPLFCSANGYYTPG